MADWSVPPNYATDILRRDARTMRTFARQCRARGAADAVIAYHEGCAAADEELLKHIEREATLIESLDALAIAADAARAIVMRAGQGGTDAVTYDGVRDLILVAMKPFTYDYEERKEQA